MALFWLTAAALAGDPAADPVLDDYEALRAALAANHFGEARTSSKQLADDARAAMPSLAEAADKLAREPKVDETRLDFGEISRQLVLHYAAVGEPAGIHVFHCPMTSAWPYWIQPTGGISNPYMGLEMPSCGEGVSFKAAAKAASRPGQP